MKAAHPSTFVLHPERHLEVFDDPIRDPYQDQATMAEPSACSECGAVYKEEHWQWVTPPMHALQTRCPACRRIDDKAPAGYVLIEGPFVQEHRDELINAIRTLEKVEKAAHPLQRIMDIKEHGGKLHVTTTDIHLARAIGEALQDTWQGKLDFNYTDADYLLRVSWQR
jgi:hypothetical protein